MDDPTDDIADEEIDVLFVSLGIESLIGRGGNENCSDREGVKSSISKHGWLVVWSRLDFVVVVVVNEDWFDDADEMEWLLNEPSAKWHVLKQCGGCP